MGNPSTTTRNRNNKNRGRANEYGLVNKLKKEGFESARRVPLSGAMANHKGDVEVIEASTLIEAKVYQVEEDVKGEEYIRFKLGWVEKAQQEAQEMGFKHSAVIVRGAGEKKRFVVLSMDEWLGYLEYCKG